MHACVCERVWELVCVWERVQVCVCVMKWASLCLCKCSGLLRDDGHKYIFVIIVSSFTENHSQKINVRGSQSSPFCLNHTQHSNISRLCWHTNYLLIKSVAVVPIMFKNLFLTKHITVISTTVLFVGCPVERHWLHVCLQRLDLWLQCQLCGPGQNSGWPAQS